MVSGEISFLNSKTLFAVFQTIECGSHTIRDISEMFEPALNSRTVINHIQILQKNGVVKSCRAFQKNPVEKNRYIRYYEIDYPGLRIQINRWLNRNGSKIKDGVSDELLWAAQKAHGEILAGIAMRDVLALKKLKERGKTGSIEYDFSPVLSELIAQLRTRWNLPQTFQEHFIALREAWAKYIVLV